MDRVAESLFVGTVEDAGEESRLRDAGIETVTSLTHSPPDAGFPDSVSVTRIPLTDGPQNERAQFGSAVDAVVEALESDETVLVHCSRGASRSPSVAAAALAIDRDVGIEAAFEQVATRREACDPHDALVRRAVAVAREW